MKLDVEKINQINPRFAASISSLLELNSDNKYIIEINDDKCFRASDFNRIGDKLLKALNQLGIDCIIIPRGIIDNIYKLEGGESNDSRASTE